MAGVVVAEMYGHRVVWVDKDKQVFRLCGTDESGSGSSQLCKPAAVLVHSGHLWIADLGNHRITVVKWPASSSTDDESMKTSTAGIPWPRRAPRATAMLRVSLAIDVSPGAIVLEPSSR